MDITVNLLRAIIIGSILTLPHGRWGLGNWVEQRPCVSAYIGRLRHCLHEGSNEGVSLSPAVPGGAVTAVMSTNSKAVATKVLYDELTSPLVRHIVYIIDESVRGDYIQLNNNKLTNTPFLSGLRPEPNQF